MIGSSARQLGHRRDDLRAQHRVGVHDHPLFAGQALLLEQDVVGDADLADVVEQAAPLERLELASLSRMTRPMSTAMSLTRLAVLAGEGIPLVDGLRQAPMVCVNISRISTNR